MSGGVTTLAVQTALAERGFDPGPEDGIRGRRTILALKAFQTAEGIAPTGLVDAATATALFGEDAAGQALPDATVWMDQAHRMKGLHETLDRERLTAFLASDGDTVGDPAVVPWCADFVQTCIALSLPEEPLPTNPYASISWMEFGRPVPLCPGAIVCLWRETPDSWKGHVAFCVETSGDRMLILGGNQGDSISEKWVDQSALREGGSRWPLTALPPPVG